MQLHSVKVESSIPGVQIVLAQSQFIKTVEDVYESLMNSVPGIRFGIAFCEASGPCLVRRQGNEPQLEDLASEYAFRIACGHSIVVLFQNAFPVNVLPHLRANPELLNIYCATANPIEVIIAETDLGRSILGVVDGSRPKGIEGEAQMRERRDFLRSIGYKL
ncbi:MAG: adenosine-specific kinase [Nitrososphaera sp.]|jgi:adenosine/AMP kinase